MRRAAVALALAICLLASGFSAMPVAAAPPGAVTWTVDHGAKTITVKVRLQIYPGCSGNPIGVAVDQARACRGSGGEVTAFLARKLKEAIERVWTGLSFRCYQLVVDVDVSLGTDRDHVDPDRVGVRIDPSPVRIRSFVSGPNDRSRWQSDRPEDRVEATNHGSHETSWSEAIQDSFETYRNDDGTLGRTERHLAAHELGHVLGLHDTYHDEPDPDHPGRVRSVRNDGAPNDLMSSSYNGTLDQATVDRLVSRNQNDLRDASGSRVRLDDLRCDYTLEIDIRMTGARPEFKAEVVAIGTIELRSIGAPAGTQGGEPITHEGRGNLAYTVRPLTPHRCAFGFEGSGGFPIGARASIPTPFDASKIVVTLAPKLDQLPKDTLIAWKCGPGTKTFRTTGPPLLAAFYTDRLGTEWRITDWDPATGARPAVAVGRWTGRCAMNACREDDEFRLFEVP